jgi:hypothetical protein
MKVERFNNLNTSKPFAHHSKLMVNAQTNDNFDSRSLYSTSPHKFQPINQLDTATKNKNNATLNSQSHFSTSKSII